MSDSLDEALGIENMKPEHCVPILTDEWLRWQQVIQLARIAEALEIAGKALWHIAANTDLVPVPCPKGPEV